MKKYGSLMLLLALIILIASQFISVHYLYFVQTALFILYLIIYLLADNQSVSFLSKFKYLVLMTILLFFFIQIKRDGGYYGLSELNSLISHIAIFFQSTFLLYVLLRVDRLVKSFDLNQ